MGTVDRVVDGPVVDGIIGTATGITRAAGRPLVAARIRSPSHHQAIPLVVAPLQSTITKTSTKIQTSQITTRPKCRHYSPKRTLSEGTNQPCHTLNLPKVLNHE